MNITPNHKTLLALATVFLSVSLSLPVWGAGDVLTIGVRDDAPPFSWRVEGDKHQGFSVELCKAIGKLAVESGDFSKYEFIGISAMDRFEALEEKKIDLLCGATTVTLERMRQFGFTLFTFLSGASYMYLESRPPVEVEHLKDKNIGVLRDTTTEELIRSNVATVLTKFDPSVVPESLSVISIDSHFDSIGMLQRSEIDVYFADREILLSLRGIAREKHELDFKVADGYLTYEPYALVVRRDEDDLLFRANQTLVRLFKDRKIFDVFRNWFPRKAMSKSLEQFYILQQVPEN